MTIQKELRVDELYKKHFLFWKSWQEKLIERLDDSYKKRIVCYDRLLRILELEKVPDPASGKSSGVL